MKRILFISAINPVSEVGNRYHPLWPAYLAANVEKHLGLGVFEFRFMTNRIEDELASFKPHIVAISSVTQNYNYAIGYARIAKEQGLPVIIGGMHITSVPDCLSKDMDVGCIGEGEETFLELMRCFVEYGGFRPESLAGIMGIVYHDNGKVAKTPDRPVCNSLDELPHPKRSIIGYGYRSYLYTARGCPFNCVFCACSRYWGEVRYASAEYVIEEIRELVENGVKVIRFADDNLVANKKRLQRIADMVVANGFHKRVKFSCWCRSNSVTPDAVKNLKSMNVVSVKMGLESGCDRTLQYLKGNVTVKDNWNAVKLLKGAGIQVNGDFIIGAPDETEEEIMQTYEFIKNAPLDLVDINILSPLPGTPIWEYAAKRNLVTDDMDWSSLNFKFNDNDASSVILSERLTHGQLARIYKKFARLRLFRTLKALPGSPWINEFPGVALRLLTEKVVMFAQRKRKVAP